MYRQVFLSRPKGRAKSELGGELTCVELLGPVRFDGWDAHGNPVGAPVTAPEILCVATEASQAGNTFDNAVYMLQNGAVYDEYSGLDIGITRVFLAEGGSIEPITAAATSKDGGKSSFVVADEVHLWTLERLKKLYDTISRNITKRRLANGWLFSTSTMFAPGEGSVAEELHDSAKANPAVLFDHRQAELDVDITDDDQLREALRYVYGAAAEWTNIEGIIADEFRDPRKRESDNRRYWLNQPWTLEERFVAPVDWDACADASRIIDDGATVVLAFDGSFNKDSTGLLVVSVEETPVLEVGGCWEKPHDAIGDWRVPRLEVMDTIRGLCRRFDVLEVIADAYQWTQSLEELADEGIPVAEFPQTSTRMIPATQRFYDRVMSSAGKRPAGETDEVTAGGLTHTGDERLRRHVLNAVLKKDYRGNRLSKETKGSPNKIDLAICAAMGLDRAAHYVTEGTTATILLPSEFRESEEPEYSPDGFRILRQGDLTLKRCRVCQAPLGPASTTPEDYCSEH